MIIRINGANADIQIETEKTVGEILGAFDSWLSGTGHRLSGISIDEEPVSAGGMDACFIRDIDTIQILDIKTSSLPELLEESFCNMLQDIDVFEEAGFEEKAPFLAQWKESPQSLLLAEQYPDFYNWALMTFSGEGSNPQILRLMSEERLRELQDPQGEISRAATLVAEVCKRLEDLPLDMQTGKDARAAETANAFSGIAEKLFRVFNILKMEGFPVEDIIIEDMPVTAFFAEFNDTLRNLLDAYEQRDTVLVGDIAEYEIAPKLRNLYAAMINLTMRIVK
jgi:hypothetical protein